MAFSGPALPVGGGGGGLAPPHPPRACLPPPPAVAPSPAPPPRARGVLRQSLGGVVADAKKPGYRDTLNMPETAFPMKAELARREPERLQAWKLAEAYAQLRRRRKGRDLWLLHDGPPYS